MSENYMHCITACSQLIANWLYRVDAHDIPGFVDLFAEDGVIDRLGTLIEGKSAIEDWMHTRPKERITRHMFSLPAIEPIDEKTAKGLVYFAVFESTADKLGENGFYPMNNATTMGEYPCEFVLTEKGWKISKLTIMPVFRK